MEPCTYLPNPLQLQWSFCVWRPGSSLRFKERERKSQRDREREREREGESKRASNECTAYKHRHTEAGQIQYKVRAAEKDSIACQRISDGLGGLRLLCALSFCAYDFVLSLRHLFISKANSTCHPLAPSSSLRINRPEGPVTRVTWLPSRCIA